MLMIPAFAAFAEESISITIKPSKALAGTTSYNLHATSELTKLVYVSRSDIQEHSIQAAPEQIERIKSDSLLIIQEVMDKTNFDEWKENSGSFAVAITQDKVTKSISTKRLSESMLRLQELLNTLK